MRHRSLAPWDPTGAVPGHARRRVRVRAGPRRLDRRSARWCRTRAAPATAPRGRRTPTRRCTAPCCTGATCCSSTSAAPGLSRTDRLPGAAEAAAGRYPPAARACAARLGARAHLYGTALSADDLAAVITALGLGKVDVYGDSYGTFFTQVYRRPAPGAGAQRRRSTRPTRRTASTAWYPTQGPAHAARVQHGLPADAVLRAASGSHHGAARASSCAPCASSRSAAGSTARTAQAAHGHARRRGPGVPRLQRDLRPGDLPRARRRDPRVVARRPTGRRCCGCGPRPQYPGGGRRRRPTTARALDAAVSCPDYPQLYDMRATPAVRRAQYRGRRGPPHRHQAAAPTAPFTIREYLRSDWAGRRTGASRGRPRRRRTSRGRSGRRAAATRPACRCSCSPASSTRSRRAAEGDDRRPRSGRAPGRSWSRTRSTSRRSATPTLRRGHRARASSRTRAHGAAAPGQPRCASHRAPVRATPAYRARTPTRRPPRALARSTRSRLRLRAVTHHRRDRRRRARPLVPDVRDRRRRPARGPLDRERRRTWCSGSPAVRLVRDLAVSGTVRWARYGNRVRRRPARGAATTSTATPVAGARRHRPAHRTLGHPGPRAHARCSRGASAARSSAPRSRAP